MGKPRVRGSHAVITVNDSNGAKIQIGEVNKFSVKELGELKKSRAIGEHEVTATKTFEGYDLSFEGGKVDWRLAQLLHKADVQIVNNARTPYFEVTQKISYYNQQSEVYTYKNVTIHGYNMDIDANDEITEKFEGFCGSLRSLTTPAVQAEATAAETTITAMIAGAIAKDLFGGNNVQPNG